MSLSNLSESQHAELVRLLRETIEADRDPRSLRTKRLKTILAKLEPAPLATISLALAKKRAKKG
jgi:hypothetical protein